MMLAVEIVWWIFLFAMGFLAGMLTDNFFGENKSEEMRYKYLSGDLK